MKKALLVGFILIMAIAVNAQYFGVQAGGALANMTIGDDFLLVRTRVKPAFFMGVTVDFPLKNNMAINTALNWKHAGTWTKDGDDRNAVRLNYINLDFTYDYILTLSDIQLFFEGGGYLGYAVGGKHVNKPKNGDITKEDIKFGSSEDDFMKPFDLGLIIGGGVYFGPAKLGINWVPGLLNLAPDNENFNRIRNRYVVLKATYFFNKK